MTAVQMPHSGGWNIISALLQAGADTAILDKEGKPAFWYLIRQTYWDRGIPAQVFDILIGKSKSVINVTGRRVGGVESDMTALQLLLSDIWAWNHLDDGTCLLILKDLLAAGIDTKHKDSTGKTALDWANTLGTSTPERVEAVKLLESAQ